MSKLASVSLDLEGIVNDGSIVDERPFMFDVDREKAFKKLASKQFKDPNLALREIVSNALDSYSGMEAQAEVDIVLDYEHFEVRDYGIGFTEDKIECLRTLGQSDKRGKRGYIGRFGIGFASLFHPDLKVKRVLVDTKVNGDYARLEFTVQDTGVTLKRYSLEGQPPFSTRIRAEFGGLSWDQKKKMQETLEEEAKYMNADVRLNGQVISGKALFEQTRKYSLDLDGRVSGRLCFYNPNDKKEKNTESRVALLSHNIYVASTRNSFLQQGRRDFSLPDFFGYVNSDELNVITSRNDFRKDEKYQSFVKEVRREGRKYFRDLCKEVNRTRESELREILVNAFSSNSRFFRDYSPEKVTDACAKALAEAKIFTCWNKLGAFSLKDLYEQAHREGHLLFASISESSELFDIQGYEGPIVRMPKYEGFSFEGVKTHNIDRLYSSKGEMNEEVYGGLVDEGILNPEKLRIKVNILDAEQLAPNEQRFLDGLRGILSSERVKEVLAKMGLDTEYKVDVAEVNPIGVAACYTTGTNQICVNRKNPLSAQYMQEQEGNTAPFYMPILAHELSHNVLSRHGNPFYDTSSELSSKLALAVAADYAEGKK